MDNSQKTNRVAIIGGGLAGLAAATVLCRQGLQVELFEATRQLGGRAGSFRDPQTDQWVDHCQHVSMGCCTNLNDFCRQTGISKLFRHEKVLHFIGPDSRHYKLQASRFLPAPLHLLPALLRLGYLTWSERIGICRALMKLARTAVDDSPETPTIGQWLRTEKQSEQAIERFWSVILVSALGESIDNASLAAARKVLIDGFMAHRHAYQIQIPSVELGRLYGTHVAQDLKNQGVKIHLGSKISQILSNDGKATAIECADGSQHPFDFVIVAVPWRRITEMIPPPLAAAIPQLASIDQIQSSPITGIHLWFDRPITPLPHAVLIDRLAQWVFNHQEQSLGKDDQQRAYYYQIVISASRNLENQDRDSLLAEILNELKAIWPETAKAHLKRWKMVNQRDAVFSVRPGFDQLRPNQKTAIPNLMLAGDWTSTGWPATMEGAVRSGYLAAEAVLDQIGQPSRLLVPDLKKNLLAKWIIKETPF